MLLQEIRDWLDAPGNEQEFLIVFFDDQPNLQTWVGLPFTRNVMLCAAADYCLLAPTHPAPCPTTAAAGRGGPPAGGHPDRLPPPLDPHP